MSPLDELKKAISDEGKSPEYHRKIMAQHRKEWPALWAAIDKLISHK